MLTEKQMRKMVYEKYPITKREAEGCIVEMMENRKNRDKFKKQLIAEQKEKKTFE